MSSKISLFMGFCIGSLDDKVQSDIIVRSNTLKTILMITFFKKTTNVIFYKKMNYFDTNLSNLYINLLINKSGKH